MSKTHQRSVAKVLSFITVLTVALWGSPFLFIPQAQAKQNISLSPSALDFSVKVGGQNPPAQTFTITGTNDCRSGSINESQDWLSVNKSDFDTSSGPVDVEVSVDISDYSKFNDPNDGKEADIKVNPDQGGCGNKKVHINLELEAGIDLSVTKTNSLNGDSAVLGNAFTWKLHVASNGADGAAIFQSGETILLDELVKDNDRGVKYGDIRVEPSGMTGNGGVGCTLNDQEKLQCKAKNGWVVMPADSFFDVFIEITPLVVPQGGNLINPRADGKCAVDSEGKVAETKENNNSCNSNSVTVVKSRTGSISGYKWNDANGNRNWDLDELALEGWTIELEDENGDRYPATTGNNGYYKFNFDELGLSDGEYWVCEQLQGGWEQTYPYNGVSNATECGSGSQGPWGYDVWIEKGDSATNMNFGNWRGVTITGYKFDDSAGNRVGIWDKGEPGIENWTVALGRVAGQPGTDGHIPIEIVAMNLTGADGQFVISGVKPGQYKLFEEQREGWMTTHPSRVDSFFDIDYGNFNRVPLVQDSFFDVFVDVGLPGGDLITSSSHVQISTDGQSVETPLFGNWNAPIISDQQTAAVPSNYAGYVVSWLTDDHLATSRVIYDTVPHAALGDGPCPGELGALNCYGYAFSTLESDTGDGKTMNHFVTLAGLSEGTTYYYRVVSHGSPEAVSVTEGTFTTNVTPPPQAVQPIGGGPSNVPPGQPQGWQPPPSSPPPSSPPPVSAPPTEQQGNTSPPASPPGSTGEGASSTSQTSTSNELNTPSKPAGGVLGLNTINSPPAENNEEVSETPNDETSPDTGKLELNKFEPSVLMAALAGIQGVSWWVLVILLIALGILYWLFKGKK